MSILSKLETADPGDPLLNMQVELLYDQAQASQVAAATMALLLVALFWASTPVLVLITWLVAFLGITALRVVLINRYQLERSSKETDYWLLLFLAGTAAAGAAWGIAPIVLPAEQGLLFTGFALLWVGGMAAGGVASLCAVKAVYLAFAIPALLPTAVYLLFVGGKFEIALSGAITLFFVFLSFQAFRMHKTMLSGLQLQLQNMDLIKTLNLEKETVQIINREMRETMDQLKEEVNERKQVETALRKSEERYRILYDENPSMLFTIDEEYSVVSVNQCGTEELGYEAEELVGNSVLNLFHMDDVSAAENHLRITKEITGRILDWEVRILRKDGKVLWVRETTRVAEDESGHKIILMVSEDITEAHRLSERLSFQASHDVLTGLVNRREFEQRLNRLLRLRNDEEIEHALSYLDLDQFKLVNDSCGHVAGDELLRQIAKILQKRVRRGDTLARLGGDEFVILMQHCSLSKAEGVANTLLETLKNFRFSWGEQEFRVGASIGVVPIDEETDDVTSLLSKADQACYAAKEEGRNRVHVYHDADTDLKRRRGELMWVQRIDRALREGRFELYYQDIIEVDSHEHENRQYEFLLRMFDKGGEIHTPEAFLQAAERYNLAANLDRWMIEAMLAWIQTHPHQFRQMDLCNINLSASSFGDQELLTYLISQFGHNGIDPTKLCFEITEAAAVANLVNANQFISTLKEHGCKFALDDFGSGLSSFAYLKNLPVDYLKIDGAFVRGIVEDPIDFAMVVSINEIGHVMGKKTIAEFVENAEILKKLKEIGVDYAQGYGISKPRPITDLT